MYALEFPQQYSLCEKKKKQFRMCPAVLYMPLVPPRIDRNASLPREAHHTGTGADIGRTRSATFTVSWQMGSWVV